MVWRSVLRVLLVVLLLGGAPLSRADRSQDHDRDHDRARMALEKGEILPLATVLERVARSHPGEVMAVELEPEGGRWLYELKILLQDGRLGKIEVDARTGEVIDMRVKETRRDGRGGTEKDRREGVR